MDKPNLLRYWYGENNINTGPIKEIPEICVDHFVGDDLNSTFFFLTHAHTDHMVGLETNEFRRRLNQHDSVKLYTHHLTPILLGFFERYLGGKTTIKELIGKKKIVPLDVNKSFKLNIRRPTEPLVVTVTPLSAGHCPGSVMYLFETRYLKILHTGDFRLTLEDLKRMPPLHNSPPRSTVPIKLDHLYVDTTFCSTSANLFPNRKEVIQEAMERIKAWVAISKKHIVNISFSARFAHEYVLLEIYKTFQQKIHVTEDRLEIYKNIPDLYKIVTLDDDTQFHLCNRKECEANLDGQSITLRLSSMWFTKGKEKEEDETKEAITWNGSLLQICYSMHSSLQEIASTIDYLKPRIVTPLVLPKNSNLEEVRKALVSVCRHKRFKFADYYSRRADFDEDSAEPLEPLKEERDESDEVPGNGEDDSENESSSQSSTDSSISSLSSDSPGPSPPKKLKVVWNFSLSPSSSSSQESDLNDSPNKDKDPDADLFVKPLPPPPLPGPSPSTSSSSQSFRRNLNSALSSIRAPPSPDKGTRTRTSFNGNDNEAIGYCGSSAAFLSKTETKTKTSDNDKKGVFDDIEFDFGESNSDDEDMNSQPLSYYNRFFEV